MSSSPDDSSQSPSTNGQQASPNVNGKDKDKDKDKKHLVIEEKTYFVVAATLGSVELLVDYVKIVLNIEMLTTDVMSRLIEYLKVPPVFLLRSVFVSPQKFTDDLGCLLSSPSTLGRVKSYLEPELCVQPVSRISPQSILVRHVIIPSLTAAQMLIFDLPVVCCQLWHLSLFPS